MGTVSGTKETVYAFHIVGSEHLGGVAPSGAVLRVGRGPSKAVPFRFSAACVQCGAAVADELKVGIREEVKGAPVVRAATEISVPYCSEHIALTQRLRMTKRLIYGIPCLLSVAAVAQLPGILSPGPDLLLRIFAVAVGGVALWAEVVVRLLNAGLIVPLMRLFDREGLFYVTTETYGFTARIIKGELYFYFRDPSSAQRFEIGNADNPYVEQVAPARK